MRRGQRSIDQATKRIELSDKRRGKKERKGKIRGLLTEAGSKEIREPEKQRGNPLSIRFLSMMMGPSPLELELGFGNLETEKAQLTTPSLKTKANTIRLDYPQQSLQKKKDYPQQLEMNILHEKYN